jgi:hypothetical protein
LNGADHPCQVRRVESIRFPKRRVRDHDALLLTRI